MVGCGGMRASSSTAGGGSSVHALEPAVACPRRSILVLLRTRNGRLPGVVRLWLVWKPSLPRRTGQVRWIMSRLIRGVVVLLCGLIFVLSGALAQAQIETSLQTIKGDLLSIKGDVYLIKDVFGRLVYLHVDKNTKRERVLVPGERIEADVVMTGERVVALRPAK